MPENSWPEQDAVERWFSAHAQELKESVSAFRIKRDAERQTCPQRHTYLAASHEYPCPYCDTARLEKIIANLADAQARLSTLERVVRAGLSAPSGERICCCHNRNTVLAGLETPCWYCQLVEALVPLAEVQ